MKIALAVLLTLVLALTFGLVYAEEMSGKMSEAGLYNGITYFDTGPAPDCTSISGVGAGGLAVPEMNNGVTSFELGVAGSGARGICAGWTGEEAPPTAAHNGVTLFE
jgi:hypothetical protein